MKLGIVAVNAEYGAQLAAIASAALQRGWAVRIFLNDLGLNLIEDPALAQLAEAGAVVSYCETSLRNLGMDPSKMPRAYKRGTQLNHAMLQQSSDQVLFL